MTNAEYLQHCIADCRDMENYSTVVPITRLRSLLADLEQRDKLLEAAKHICGNGDVFFMQAKYGDFKLGAVPFGELRNLSAAIAACEGGST